MTSQSVHTIPVPPGWSVEQAWETISRSELLPTDYPESECGWASVVVEGYTDDGTFVTGGRLVGRGATT